MMCSSPRHQLLNCAPCETHTMTCEWHIVSLHCTAQRHKPWKSSAFPYPPEVLESTVISLAGGFLGRGQRISVNDTEERAPPHPFERRIKTALRASLSSPSNKEMARAVWVREREKKGSRAAEQCCTDRGYTAGP
jgi:hypothetical protein